MSSQQRQTPRLSSQLRSKSQIPKLVSIYDSDTLTARHHFNDLQRILEQSQYQNEQLRCFVRELTTKSQQLHDMNDALLLRLKDIQIAYRSLRGELEESRLQSIKQERLRVYATVEEYINKIVRDFTQELKVERITPRMEDKIQTFLGIIVQINPISVEQGIRGEYQYPLHRREKENNTHEDALANSTLKASNTLKESRGKTTSQRKDSPSPLQYQTVINKINLFQKHRGEYSPFDQKSSEKEDKRNNKSKDKVSLRQTAFQPKRQQYNTTPQRRRRIFQ